MSAAVAAKKWIALKAKEKKIEKQFQELQAVLEPALRSTPEKKAEFHGWKFSIVEYVRRSFSLKAAEKQIDAEILAPYVSESDVVTIRTNWEGGEAA